MKKRMLAMILALFTTAMTACTMNSVAEEVDVAPTPSPTVQVSDPVTRADYPMLFLQGLSQVGVVPEQSHHIGIVIGTSSRYAANYEEFCALGMAYEDAFDITVTVERADDASQIDSVENMLSVGIDFLIFVPGGAEPLGEVDALCASQGIPYLTIGRRIEATPGEGSYVCTIEQDDYYNGMLAGQSIVDTLTAQYGEPFGNIAEITGVVSDTKSILRSSGLRRALAPYESLNVVCSVVGNDDEDTIYKAAENIFKAYREGELDGIVVSNDSAAMTVLQVALDYDRNDVVGKIWSTGATVEGLTGVYYGQLAQTIETTSQSGMAAMEYALTYLEDGADIPAVITTLTRVFAVDSDKEAIKEMIAALNDRGVDASLESVGDYASFLPAQIDYPQRYDTYVNIDAYLGAYDPYTTQKAIYLSETEETAEDGDSENEDDEV